MSRVPKFIWLIIPAVVFVVLLVVLVMRLSKPQPNSTSIPSEALPSTYVFPSPTPKTVSSLEILIQDISQLDIEDSRLAPPPLDTNISLSEK